MSLYSIYFCFRMNKSKSTQMDRIHWNSTGIPGFRGFQPESVEEWKVLAVWSSLMAGKARHSVGRFSTENICWIWLESWIVGVSNCVVILTCRRTARISHASITRSQSISESVNADHSMCFETQPSCWIVVIGPYQWSAAVINKLMDY